MSPRLESVASGTGNDDVVLPAALGAPVLRLSSVAVGDGIDRAISFDAADRAEIAEALEVANIARLAIDVALRPTNKGRISGTMRLRGKIEQACVITLDPVITRIDETVPADFWPAGQIARWEGDRGAEAEFDANTPDPLPIVDDRIDLGRLLWETLVVCIDPNPRAGDARMGDVSTETDAERAADHPFAALARLRGGDEKT
ncbi:MAG: YceD family protein [Pseudomonadota bacterium]